MRVSPHAVPAPSTQMYTRLKEAPSHSVSLDQMLLKCGDPDKK